MRMGLFTRSEVQRRRIGTGVSGLFIGVPADMQQDYRMPAAPSISIPIQ